MLDSERTIHACGIRSLEPTYLAVLLNYWIELDQIVQLSLW